MTTVCQFNVQYPAFRDAKDMPWSKALPRIIALLRGCDFAALNECGSDQAQQIATALGMQHDTDELNTVLWPSTWTKIGRIAITLPGPTYGYIRTLLAVTLRGPGGTVLTVASTHFETLASGWAKTEAQAQKLRDQQATKVAANLPKSGVILAGDLNDRDTTTGPRAILRAAGYMPVRSDGIDEIFTTAGLTVTSSQRVSSGGASDHDMLRAEVSMPVTAADFAAVLKSLGATGGQCVPVADLALGANLALDGISPVAAAVWLATLTQESAYFRTTEEYSKTGSYAPYIGRTFEQITWRDNYAAFGAWCVHGGYIATDSLFVDHPQLLAEMQWAWLGGVWYFVNRGLWPSATKGDYQSVSNAVNRGTLTTSGYPSGWDARLKCYQAWTARVVKPAKLTITKAMDGPTSKRLQQFVGVAMDGDVGKVTWSAVQKWLGRTVDGSLSAADVKALQTKIGAYVDGDFGPGTTGDLQRYLNVNGV